MSIILPDWFSIVRREVCHRCSVEGLRNILETGAIRPNDGSFPDTYPQSQDSYARANHYVSLFDFATQTEQECVQQMHYWYRFFFDQKPVTIVILLDRQSLAARLIPNKEAQEHTGERDYPIFLPGVEAFYPEPIPCELFTGYLIICGVYEKIYEYISHHGAFPGLFDRIDRFMKEHEEIYQDR